MCEIIFLATKHLNKGLDLKKKKKLMRKSVECAFKPKTGKW